MLKIIPLLLALFALAGCSAPAQAGSPESGYKQVTMEAAITLMAEEEDCIILDVRTAQEYCEKHIPNAVNIPNETIGSEEIPPCPTRTS